ncbi:uncharacterized protein V1510DRAFT_434179 [Dipodascopsis tothii]|uniref:uncharacterized protein n=1 Tax=Dipodascopsis tothii TaxID=44089 RepID=UPI0034CEE06E
MSLKAERRKPRTNPDIDDLIDELQTGALPGGLEALTLDPATLKDTFAGVLGDDDAAARRARHARVRSDGPPPRAVVAEPPPAFRQLTRDQVLEQFALDIQQVERAAAGDALRRDDESSSTSTAASDDDYTGLSRLAAVGRSISVPSAMYAAGGDDDLATPRLTPAAFEPFEAVSPTSAAPPAPPAAEPRGGLNRNYTFAGATRDAGLAAGLAPAAPALAATATSLRASKSQMALRARLPSASSENLRSPLRAVLHAERPRTTHSSSNLRLLNLQHESGLPSPTDSLASLGLSRPDDDPFDRLPAARAEALAAYEPCPETAAARPFWLLRLVRQILTHSRGGFLSPRLFIPHDVLALRGVKLRAIEDKTAAVEAVAAALADLPEALLATDADAFCDRFTALELVVDRTEAQLARKLGADVVGKASVFADPAFVDAPPAPRRTASLARFSPEALRTPPADTRPQSYFPASRKGSVASSASAVSAENVPPSAGVLGWSKKIKLKKAPDPRPLLAAPARRDDPGPFTAYFRAVALLCERAQVLDRLLVALPALEGSVPARAHLRLDIGIKHVAEIFGSVFCRFVLADLLLLLGKYIKRSARWIAS